MNRIITISREFGSGGRELGRRLSEALGIAYFDQEIIREVSKRTALSEQYIQAVTERRPSFSYPIHVGNSLHHMMGSVGASFEQTMSVYEEQARFITEIAAKADCVIVGRCADHILKEYEPFRIFVYAEMASKIRRCREKAPEDEDLTDKELRRRIAGIDKRRSQFYEFYTGHPWGDKLNFDLCINTTNTGIKKIAAAVARLFD